MLERAEHETHRMSFKRWLTSSNNNSSDRLQGASQAEGAGVPGGPGSVPAEAAGSVERVARAQEPQAEVQEPQAEVQGVRADTSSSHDPLDDSGPALVAPPEDPQRAQGTQTAQQDTQADPRDTQADPEMPFGDGASKVFGLENFGYTCYCNSILQCLYYTTEFRQEVLRAPARGAGVARVRKLNCDGAKVHHSRIQDEPASGPAQDHATAPATPATAPATPAEPKPSRLSLGRRTSNFFGRKQNSSDIKEESIEPAQQPAQPPQHYTLLQKQANNSNIILGKPEELNATLDARKKSSLLRNPIINLDHSLNQYGIPDSIFTSIKDLFESIVENEHKIGIVSPSFVIETLKRENALFRSTMHQDAHEFFNFLLNSVIDTLNLLDNTRIEDLFREYLVNETKCLTCEMSSERDECFLDLSIDLHENGDIQECLNNFRATEILSGMNKFYCDNCMSLQEAEKKIDFKNLPKILTLHLKRFEFSEDAQCNVKLFTKITYPLYFKFQINNSKSSTSSFKYYQLYGVVVHIGSGPQHGHYVSIVKTEQHGWLLFDDEVVEKTTESFVTKFIGDTPDLATAYILFYRECDCQTYEDNSRRLDLEKKARAERERDTEPKEKEPEPSEETPAIEDLKISSVSSFWKRDKEPKPDRDKDRDKPKDKDKEKEKKRNRMSISGFSFKTSSKSRS